MKNLLILLLCFPILSDVFAQDFMRSSHFNIMSEYLTLQHLYECHSLTSLSLVSSSGIIQTTFQKQNLADKAVNFYDNGASHLTKGEMNWIMRKGFSPDKLDLSDRNIHYSLESVLNSRRTGNVLLITGASLTVASAAAFGALIPFTTFSLFTGENNFGGLMLATLGMMTGITIEIIGVAKRIRANRGLNRLFIEY